MDLKQSHFSLTEYIRRHSIQSRDAYQVIQRMKKLLPDNLKSLKAIHRSGNSAAKAERLAYTDKEYLNLIEEYLALYEKGLESRIQSETHRMLLSARQTLRSFHKSF